MRLICWTNNNLTLPRFAFYAVIVQVSKISLSGCYFENLTIFLYFAEISSWRGFLQLMLQVQLQVNYEYFLSHKHELNSSSSQNLTFCNCLSWSLTSVGRVAPPFPGHSTYWAIPNYLRSRGWFNSPFDPPAARQFWEKIFYGRSWKGPPNWAPRAPWPWPGSRPQCRSIWLVESRLKIKFEGK